MWIGIPISQDKCQSKKNCPYVITEHTVSSVHSNASAQHLPFHLRKMALGFYGNNYKAHSETPIAIKPIIDIYTLPYYQQDLYDMTDFYLFHDKIVGKKKVKGQEIRARWEKMVEGKKQGQESS